MNRSGLLYFLSFVFLIFAVVQFNDPDGWKWVIIYGVVSLMALPVIIRRLPGWTYKVVILVYIIIAGLYIPDFFQWIKGGMTDLTSSMSAESPEIELTREFLGILIALSALIFISKTSKMQLIQ